MRTRLAAGNSSGRYSGETGYEITENITEEPEEAVTIKEASKRLNRTVGSLYGAAAEGRLINGRYYLRAADRTLSRNKDRNLLLEYDLVRQKLLKKGRG